MILKPVYLTIFILPFILGSCFTSSMLQTAKPLEKKKCEFTGGLTGYFRGETLPGLNTMLRVGTGRKSDMGIGYAWGIGHFRIDYKYNFYRSADENRFMSTGLGLEYYIKEWEDAPVPAVNVPLYFSINHKGNCIPYFMQRFSFGLNDPKVLFNNKAEGDHTMFYTGGAGIRYGKSRVKWYGEVSYSLEDSRNRYTGQNAANEPEIYYAHFQNAGVEVNIGLTFTFGGKSKNNIAE